MLVQLQPRQVRTIDEGDRIASKEAGPKVGVRGGVQSVVQAVLLGLNLHFFHSVFDVRPASANFLVRATARIHLCTRCYSSRRTGFQKLITPGDTTDLRQHHLEKSVNNHLAPFR